MNLAQMKKDGLVVNLQGKDYVTSGGLKFLADERYGEDGYTIQTHLVSQEEFNMVRQMLCLGDAEQYVVSRGEVWVKGNDKPFVAYGSAHAGNMKGFVKMTTYPIEMSGTRAVNRALRLATDMSLTSVDELPGDSGGGSQAPPPPRGQGQYRQPPPQQQQEEKPLASEKQRERLAEYALDLENGLTEENRRNIEKALANQYLTQGAAGRLLGLAKNVISKNEKENGNGDGNGK